MAGSDDARHWPFDDFQRGQTVRALARNVKVSGQRAYLYYFTYPGKGATAGDGAFHSLDTAFVAGGHFPKARWVKPRLLVDAEFRGKTAAGLLRHPSFKGVREDLI